MPEEPKNVVAFNIDLSAVGNLAMLGVKRAIAFIGMGLHRNGAPMPTSLALNTKFAMHWFPDPLPADAAANIVTEYNAWLTGSALKELDQFFGRFLDEVWHIIRLAGFHGQKVPADFGPDKKFLDNTNIASKLTDVAKALATTLPGHDDFAAFSLARNALTHNAGIVRDRDSNTPGGLRLRWRTPTIVFKNEIEEIVIDLEVQEMPGKMKADTEVGLRMAEREKTFAAGQSVVLTGYELSAIVFSYQAMTDAVVQGLSAYLAAKGIAAPAPAAQEPALPPPGNATD